MSGIYWGFKWIPSGRQNISSRYLAIGVKNQNLAGQSGIRVLVVRFGQIGALKKHAPLVFNETYESGKECGCIVVTDMLLCCVPDFFAKTLSLNCRCCYFQTPSVVHCMNATASAQSPKVLRNFYPQTIFANFCG